MFVLKNDVQAYIMYNQKKLALEILVCSKNYPRGLSDYPGGDKMFIENGSNVRVCDPSRGRTSF
jgi:hypothetical protein